MNHTTEIFPKAILFDLDDTIIAFGAVSRSVLKEICICYSPQLGIDHKLFFDAVLKSSRHYWSDPHRHRIGRNNQRQARKEIISSALNDCGISNCPHVETIADTYSQKRMEAVHLFPGSIDTLKYFKQKGIKMALVTNGEASLQREKINRFNLARFFDGIFIEGELGFGKPEEQIYSLALKQVDATARESWIVGDNLEWEVEAPSKLGFYTVWNDIRGKGLPTSSKAKPHRIVSSIKELIR